MEGTRQDVITKINEWIDDLHAPNILWLRGHPGVGKSAIAVSVVERLHASRRLGSSFFFQRNTAVLTTPAALWRTVAFDLSRKYPGVRKTIIAKLNADVISLNMANVSMLFRHLVHEPLMACTDIPRGRLPVIVIDALDECGGLDGRYSKHRTNLLPALKSWCRLPSAFKLVITSRGEDDIVDALSTIGHQLITITSGQMVSSQSLDDVRLFLQQRFSSIATQYWRSLPPDWPGPQVIEELTRRAAGLFIYAETVLKFVIRGEPQQQLQQILRGDMRNGDMGELYSRILTITFRDPTSEVVHAFHSIVGAIILAKIPLSHLSLARLLGIETSMVDYICQGLRSVLDAADVLRFNHQSAVDFFMDPYRCPPLFLIKAESQNRQLVQACLRVMKSDLRFNICNILSSYYWNDALTDISERIERSVSPQLSYSCRFLTDHLMNIPYEEDIGEALRYFTDEQFLYWLEVLSLTKHVSNASSILLTMASWIGVGFWSSEEMEILTKSFLVPQ